MAKRLDSDFNKDNKVKFKDDKYKKSLKIERSGILAKFSISNKSHKLKKLEKSGILGKSRKKNPIGNISIPSSQKDSHNYKDTFPKVKIDDSEFNLSQSQIDFEL